MPRMMHPAIMKPKEAASDPPLICISRVENFMAKPDWIATPIIIPMVAMGMATLEA